MSATLEKWTRSALTRMLLFSKVDQHPQRALSWHGKTERWMVQQGSRLLFTAAFTLFQAVMFACLIVRYCSDASLTGPRTYNGVAYPFLRAAASLLNFNFPIFIFPLCQAIITRIRRTFLGRLIPFGKAMLLHKMVATMTLIFAWAHAVAQWTSSGHHAMQSGLDFKGFFHLNFGTWAGWSGNTTLVVLTLIVARTLWRSKPLENHLPRVHQVLYLPIFLCWSIHAAFYAFSIPLSQSYYGIDIFKLFWYIGAFLSIAELSLSTVRARHNTSILKVIQHPSDVVEIQFKKEYTTIGAGQYILVCCPALNIWRSRYVSLTSAPEEDYISVHIRCSNPYTKKLANVLGCKFNTLDTKDTVSTVIGLDRNPANLEMDPAIKRILPPISVNGPFGGSGDRVFDNEIVIMVGGGTGVVPCASILKSIWYRMTYPQKDMRLRKIYFFCVLEDFVGYEWFRSLLMAMEAQDVDCNIKIHTYLTAATDAQDDLMTVINDIDTPRYSISGLREPTIYGRPKWDVVFRSILQLHAPAKAGVFVSGPTSLEHQVHITSKTCPELGFKCVWYGNDF